MIKRIGVEQLRVGMFVHDLNCGWLDHPFARNRFTVKQPEVIAKIRELGIRELYIDTEKGVDVAQDAPAKSQSEVNRELQAELDRMAATGPAQQQRTHMREERVYAERIQKEASSIITDVMKDVRLGKQVEVERVEPVVEQMVNSIFRNQDALLSLGRIRQMDQYTFEHSVSVGVLLISFAKSMGLERDVIQQIGVGALLHDIGKIKVPDAVLNKPGRLTDEEFAIMKKHVVFSREILAETPGISPAALAVAAEHHERFDGTGYPRGLKADEITPYGQMAAVVDVYDAITADRCYHKGEPPTSVLKKLLEWSKFHFNPELVQRFVHTVGIYPVGTLVRLESRRLAVVIEPGEKGLLYPVVRVVYDAEKRAFLTPRTLDLSNPPAGGEDPIVGYEDAEKWRIRPEVFME